MVNISFHSWSNPSSTTLSLFSFYCCYSPGLELFFMLSSVFLLAWYFSFNCWAIFLTLLGNFLCDAIAWTSGVCLYLLTKFFLSIHALFSLPFNSLTGSSASDFHILTQWSSEALKIYFPSHDYLTFLIVLILLLK